MMMTTRRFTWRGQGQGQSKSRMKSQISRIKSKMMARVQEMKWLVLSPTSQNDNI